MKTKSWAHSRLCGKVPGEEDELHAVNGAVDVQRLTLFQDRFGGVDVGIQSLGSWSHVCERKNKNGYCLIENKSSDVFMRDSIRLMMTQMCNTWTLSMI